MENTVSWRLHDVGMERICLMMKENFVSTFRDWGKDGQHLKNCTLVYFKPMIVALSN